MSVASLPALSLVDVRSFYESHGAVVTGKATNSKEGKEYACSCPVCGGVDRASFWESGRFCCVRGCHVHSSSVYWFLRDIKGYDHSQACAELGIDPHEMFGNDSYSQETKLPLFMLRDEPPCPKWIDAAHAFCHAAEKCLWGPKGESARAYLQSRGLTDATIRAAHLGLCPGWHTAPLEDWGLSAEQIMKTDDPHMKIPKGITLPYYVDGNIHKIQLRRPEPGPDGKYYKEVTGSSEALYNVDSIQPGQPVLLVESELDALSAQQEASDLIACVATGSTAKALTGRWIGRLLQASHILQGFDDDEAGEAGAAEWQHALSKEKVTRWGPTLHDYNDMLKAGESIRQWVETGLLVAQTELAPEPVVVVEMEVQPIPTPTDPPALGTDVNGKMVPPERIERVAAFQTRPCASCGGTDWFLDVHTPNHYVPHPCAPTLACPCLLGLRAEGKRIDAQRAMEARKAALFQRYKR